MLFSKITTNYEMSSAGVRSQQSFLQTNVHKTKVIAEVEKYFRNGFYHHASSSYAEYKN